MLCNAVRACLQATGWAGPPDLSRYGGGFKEQDPPIRSSVTAAPAGGIGAQDSGSEGSDGAGPALLGDNNAADAAATAAAGGKVSPGSAESGVTVADGEGGDSSGGGADNIDAGRRLDGSGGGGGGEGGAETASASVSALADANPGPLNSSAQFDILLGIDVVYEPELAKCLPKVIRQHLRARPKQGSGEGEQLLVAPKDPGWLSKEPGEPTPCFYFVCPAREPSTVALFVNSCVGEGLCVRVTPVGVSKVAAVGRDLSYFAGPDNVQPPYPNPPTDACLLVRGWVPLPPA